MSQLLPIAGVLLVAATCFHLVCFVKFFHAVRAERPDWVERTHFGLMRMFSGSLASALDPNVAAAVMQTAFSRRLASLQSPSAKVLGRRLRFSSVAGVLLVAISFLLVAVSP